jgi:hypothetical protein
VEQKTRYESMQLCPHNFPQRHEKHRMEKKHASTNVVGKNGYLTAENEATSMWSPCAIVNSKWIKDLSRPETLKLV